MPTLLLLSYGILPPANNLIEPPLTDPQLTFQSQRIQPAIAPSGTDELRYLALN
ncbi:Uncharacterised protein [Yersinia intermedia]|nr:Uncharacterised protein [Yersinia intermedia]